MYEKLKKIFTTIVLVLPIASQYKSIVPGISIGDLMLLLITIFILIELIMKQHKISVNSLIRSPFMWFAIYISCGSLISSMTQYYSSMTDIIVRSIRYIFYIFTATFISSLYFDFNLFIKRYRKVVLFATTFLFIQIILFNFKGYILMGTIPGLKISNPGYSEDVMRNLYSYFHRPSSIFLEPGYFAQYTLPYLAFLLFNNGESSKITKIKFIEIMFVTIGIILTTSGQGIMIALFIWGIWFMTKFYNHKDKKINLLFFLGICAFIVSIPIILKVPIVERSVARLFGSPGSSSSSRIFRGFHIYNQLDPLYKVIGVGYGNVGAHIVYKGIYTIYDTGFILSEYMNSIAYILVNLGMVGFVLMAWVFVYLWKNTSGFHRICLYILVLLSGVSTFFVSNGINFYLPIIMSGMIVKHSYSKINIKGIPKG